MRFSCALRARKICLPRRRALRGRVCGFPAAVGSETRLAGTQPSLALGPGPNNDSIEKKRKQEKIVPTKTLNVKRQR